MKKILLTFLPCLLFNYLSAQTLSWAATSSQSINSGLGNTTVDSNGNIYSIVSGSSPSFTYQGVTPTGTGTGILVKQRASGAVVWAKRYGGSFGVHASLVKVGGPNEIILTGSCTGVLSYNGSTIFTTNTAGGDDMFVLRLDTNGVFQNGFSESAGIGYIEPQGIDWKNGILAICGDFADTISIGDSIFIAPDLSGTGQNSFMALYDSGNNFLWAKHFYNPVGSDFDWASGVGFDGEGNAFVVGSYYSQVQVGDSIFDKNPFAYVSCYVGKFNATGGLVWAKNFYGITGNVSQFSTFPDIVVSEDGDCFFSAFFHGTVKIDNYILQSGPIWGTEGLLIAKIEPNGNIAWARNDFSGANYYLEQWWPQIELNNSGEIIVGGWYEGASVTMGPFSLPSTGNKLCGFIYKMRSCGEPQWVRPIPTTNRVDLVGADYSFADSCFLFGGTFRTDISYDGQTFTGNAPYGNYVLLKIKDDDQIPSVQLSLAYSDSVYCESDSINPIPVISGGNAIFSSTGNLAIDSITGEIDLAASQPGGPYPVWLISPGPCPDSSVAFITLEPDSICSPITSRQIEKLPLIKVWPNPGSGIFRIQTADLVQEARLYSAEGRQSGYFLPANNHFQIDLSNQPGGVFFLKMLFSNGRTEVVKLLKY